MAYLWLILFILSLIGNGILIWYVRNLLTQFNDGIQSVSNLQEKIDEYVMHLETISGMETYYDDTTIENLLKHTKDLSISIKDAGNQFSISPIEGNENES